MPPLVSIVTPTFNMARYLPEAIESVLSQDYSPVEYIVADGGSTDETRGILEGYGSRLRWFSGKDKGPSDAAHRGFLQARGEIFAWLNADDSYLPGAIHTAVDYLAAHPEIDVVYGEGYWIGEDGTRISRYPTLPWDPRVLERDCFICQPAAFFRASAYRKCGLDPDVNRSFDYDLWIRMAIAGLRFAAIPQYLANSRMHQGAKTIYEREAVLQASMDLLMRHYGYIPMSWVFGYAAWRRDGRDQFFEPLRPTPGAYLAALPLGLRLNPRRRLRFLGEWLAAPLGALRRRPR
ncbi:MAG: glycosyltransferase [Acidobacteria bacterium]|nr:glycosyltransferase [Acidobacteriota bacterium]